MEPSQSSHRDTGPWRRRGSLHSFGKDFKGKEGVVIGRFGGWGWGGIILFSAAVE